MMNRDRLIIGITGRAGSGKSSVSTILKEQYGFYGFNTDQVGHEVLDNLAETISKEFNLELTPDGTVDRESLGKIVFKNPEELQKLNRLVHPEIFNIISFRIENVDSKKVFIDAALLFEIGLDRLCGKIIRVLVNEEVAFDRLQKGRGWDSEKSLSVIRTQDALLCNTEHADFILDNSGDQKLLKEKIEWILNQCGIL